MNCSAVIHFGERQVHALLSSLVSAHAKMYKGSQRFCDLGRIHRVPSMAMATLPTDGSFGKGKRGAHTFTPIERKSHTEPGAKTDTPQPWNKIPKRHFPLIHGPAGSSWLQCCVTCRNRGFHFLQWSFPSTGRSFQCSLQTHVSETKTGIRIDT